MPLFHCTTIPSVSSVPLVCTADTYEDIFRRVPRHARASSRFKTGDRLRIIVWGPHGSQYRDVTLDPIVKVCSCGEQYTFADWCKRPGIDPWIDDVVVLDQRQCTCGSHITLPIAYSIDTAGREEAGHESA